MTKKVQCNHCGYIFDCEDDQEFAYCPCCENDQVEVEEDIIRTPSDLFKPSEEEKELARLRFNNMLNYGKKMALMDIPKFLKIQEDEFNVIYINLRDIVKIQECLEEDKYIFYSSRGDCYEVPSNEGTSAIVEYLLNQLL